VHGSNLQKMIRSVAGLGFKGISYAFGCKVFNGVSVRTVSNVAENNCICDQPRGLAVSVSDC
jgi:hypothetical protein